MPRILLIDDDQRFADLLRQFFARHNLTLASETLPSRGLARLERATIDLVILDVMLPEMDGPPRSHAPAWERHAPAWKCIHLTTNVHEFPIDGNIRCDQVPEKTIGKH